MLAEYALKVLSGVNKVVAGHLRKDIYKRGYWITADKQVLKISDLDENHLINIVRMLARNAYIRAQRRNPWLLPEPRGEMAQDAYWHAVDVWESEGGTLGDVLYILAGHPAWPHLTVELKRRDLDGEAIITDGFRMAKQVLHHA